METFLPPHCPNPSCIFHCSSEGWPYCKAGFHYRLRCSPARIQRFRCLHCARSFSSQTFSTTYWLHKPDLLTRVFQRSLACSGFRQIAHELGVSHTTIMNQVARLGRHCLLFQNNHRPQPCEPLVIDGFESFEYSQYFPFHFNVLVGKHSHFFYSFTESPLRRKGTMTAHQKKCREALESQLGRPDPKAIERGVADLLRSSVSPGKQLTLHSDEHPAYPRALRRLPPNSVRHLTTSSTERTTPYDE